MPEGLIDRPLSPLVPRDCGHECRVCKVTVASLTDYASHISSPTHKQNVEDFERTPARCGRDEDYFDKSLVELIEKRNKQIRKEKEAAAAKLAQEEEERKRKEEFEQRLQEAKQRFQVRWPQQSNTYGGNQRYVWHRDNQYDTNPGDVQNTRPWQHSKRGKSATWHAQEPPNFKNFQNFTGEVSSKGQDSQQWNQGQFTGINKVRPPWISSAGSSNGIYGRNNISQYSQNVRSGSLLGPPSAPLFQTMPKYFSGSQNQSQIQTKSSKGGKEKDKHKDKKSTEAEHHSKTNKAFGSNPKLDKTCRWSPYPVNKGSESMPNLLEKTSTSSHKSQKSEKAKDSSTTNVQSRSDKGSSSGRSSNSSSRSNSLQRDGQKNKNPSPSTQRANKPTLQTERRASLGANVSSREQLSKTSSQASDKAKSSSRSSLSGLSKSERELPEAIKKVRRSSLESLSNISQKKTEDQKHIGVNKENSMRQNQAKTMVSDLLKAAEKPILPDSSQSVQHLQVSTSSIESSSVAVLSQENEQNKKKIEKEAAIDKMLVDGLERDIQKSSEAQATSQSSLSRLDLPPVLKRDLTKHITQTKAKAGVSHEPNLNIARRVRNLSGSKRSDTEKDSGLRPTVRQLISSSGSRRNVNWEQVYHEVRKKQDKGKGMPRFGIEMVPMDQDGHSQEEEDDLPLLQGFHWESLMDSTPPASRKRSLSESSIAPASTHSFLNDIVPSLRSSPPQSSPSYSQYNEPDQEEMEAVLVENEDSKQADSLVKAKARLRAESITVESSSDLELCDGQGTGKKRKTTRDVPQAETSCLEHHNKRRKIKSKKERSHIDQLLAVSLREEELSGSLQTLDSELIKARAALEAAYMEVQRLMMVKQQMTTEMGTLRNKRIELLKGMKDNAEEAPMVKVKEEKLDKDEPDVHLSSSVPLLTNSTALPGGSSPAHSAPRASVTPPASCVPFTPVTVKEEPHSPVHISSEPDTLENTAHCAHSTTPELPTATAVPDATIHTPPSPERRPSDPQRDAFGDPIDSKDSLAELVQSIEKGIQATGGHAQPGSSDKVLGASWRDSEIGGFVESTGPSLDPPSVPSGFNLPNSPPELRNGKRVRKLKKRKVLNKTQGIELPESSDTEIDTEASRPKWLRTRRKGSTWPKVSTSDQQGDDRGEELRMEEEEVKGEGSQSPKTTSNQPHVLTAPPVCQAPDSSKTELQNVACHEISSTSDMDISPAAESDVQIILGLPKVGKMSSDGSSDHGDDEMPTEGVFEGHVEAVNSMQIHNGLLYTCSGDRTVRAFDIVTHRCVAVFEGHTSKVNALLLSTSPCLHHRLYTASSDQTIRCYSLTTQNFEQQFSLSDRVLCLHNRWKIMYAGLGNGTVVTFNLKTNKQMDVFECHGPRAVSCLASSQEGARRLLLVGSYDNTISVRDAKNGLLLRTLEGHSKTVLCMKVVNDLVFSGSSDQCVYAHNIHTGKMMRVYKGHSHAVSVVSVLGKVMVTACLDKLVRCYDLQSHEQLQVYGGHRDMVMCMTIHKNMIYTGCYDGSVQAIKLNLMQNYHCRWHGCSLVFGVLEHLEHHLTHDHSGPNTQMLRCRWKNCEEFLSARHNSRQAIPLHMQKHAAEESHVEP